MPKFVSGIGALAEAARLRDNTLLVSAGSITPSSHNLLVKNTFILCIRVGMKLCHIISSIAVLNLCYDEYDKPSLPGAGVVGTAFFLIFGQYWSLESFFFFNCPLQISNCIELRTNSHYISVAQLENIEAVSYFMVSQGWKTVNDLLCYDTSNFIIY